MPPFWGKKREEVSSPPDAEKLVENAIELYSSSPSSKPRGNIKEMAEKALTMNPSCYSAHVLLGYLDMDDSNLDGMQGHFLKALELAPDPYNEYTWDWVVMCLDDGLKDYKRLTGYLTRFYEKKPEGFVAQYLAKTYIKLGQPQNAMSALQKHLTMFPEDKDTLKLKRKIESKA